MRIARPLPYHFAQVIHRPREHVAILHKQHKSWLELTWQDYYRSAEAVALALTDMGLKPAERVAVLSQTRWEWGAIDMAVLGLGAVTVPIYPSSRPEEIEHIIQDSKAKFLFVDNRDQLKRWEAVARRCKQVEHVVLIDPDSTSSPVKESFRAAISWDDFLRSANKKRPTDFFEKRCGMVNLEDLATLVYTSGTTGLPKGARLTHRQVMGEVEAIAQIFPITPSDRSLSFLPYAHILGRLELWLHAFMGFTMAFAQSIERLSQDLRATQPTVIVGVPRVFEKIFATATAQIQGSTWNKTWLKWIGQTMLSRRLKEGFGGKLRFAISGGAPLEQRISEFFARAGILVLEGYGLTETTGAITVNTPGDYEFGTVGKAIPGVEVRIAEDGEILVKGLQVMEGYENEDNANTFRDGYLCTGDIGELDADGFLRITDRKKDLIKTAGGKYVAPQKLENLLKLNPLVSHALIHGDRRKYIVALITLNEPLLKKMGRDREWRYRDYAALTQSEEVQKLVRNMVAEVNAQLASFETIKNFAILPRDFTMEQGELTPSLKVKRKICDEHFRETLENLY